jgi:uncharacterized protein (DUF58 family)
MPDASGSRVLTMLAPHQKRSYVARTWLVHRGGFSLGPTVLKSGDPFGLFQVSKQFNAHESLIVLPKMFEISTFPSPPGLLPGERAIQRKSLDVTPHAAGVREYTTGDTLKRIHWPTTARRGKLMVKEFEQDPQAEVWLFLDAERRVQAQLPYEVPETHVDALFFGKRPRFNLPPSTLEYSISITASLAHYFILQKRAVGFVTAGRVYTVILAERSVRQESKILETLAFLEGDGRLSLAAVITAQSQQLPMGSSIILVTPSTSNELLIAVDDLQRRNLRPIVVLLNGESFGIHKDPRPVIHSLSERNIPICQIDCGADLTKALSMFASNDISKELLSWLKTPS